MAVGPMEGCTSSYIFNYYGSGGPAVDPKCHPGASAVQSYRHSHYGKNRLGANIDGEWSALFGGERGSVLRAGIWYEDSQRDLGRDWHRILDPAINFKWDDEAYWHQYEWDFPQSVFKWYAEETLYFGSFELTAGIKQYLISVSRVDEFGIDRDLDVGSDSKLLLSGGVTYETPVEGLGVFVGYAQNFRAIGSNLLEVPGRSLDRLEPETASNIDVGIQYAGERLALSATLYSIDFDNRIFYLGPQTPAGPNYLIPGGGGYFNAGGIETSGIELATTVALSGRTSLYTALTLNDSKYVGTDDPLVDSSQGIVPGTDVAGVPPRLWVISLDRDGPLGGGGVHEVHGGAARQSLGGLVHRPLLDRGRLRQLPRRGAERTAPVDGVLDRGEQPARHRLSVRDHRERRLARCAPDDIHDHDDLVLSRRGGPRRSKTRPNHRTMKPGPHRRTTADAGLWKGLNPAMAVAAKGLVLAFVVATVWDVDTAGAVFGRIRDWIEGTLGWFYFLAVGASVLACLFLVCSRFGTVRLGDDASVPEFKTSSWLAMLFSAGIGIGLLFFSISEPLFYFDNSQTAPGVPRNRWSRPQVLRAIYSLSD